MAERKGAQDAERGQGVERDEKGRQADDERRAREAEEIDHQANVNQVRDEPIPASQHDDRRQEAVGRNEEYAYDSEERR